MQTRVVTKAKDKVAMVLESCDSEDEEDEEKDEEKEEIIEKVMEKEEAEGIVPEEAATQTYLDLRKRMKGISREEDFDDPSTNQHRALGWLAKHWGPKMLPGHATDTYIVALLYFATSGADENGEHGNWNAPQGGGAIHPVNNFLNPDKPVCEWQLENDVANRGIFCHEDFTVRIVDLPHMNLTGTIPAEITHLNRMVSLYLHNNKLRGTIPDHGYGHLKESLVNLLLHHNHLMGSIPSALGQLHRLQTIGLQSNMLTGTIPTNLGDLSGLIRLELHGNKLSGPLPSEIGNAGGTLEVLQVNDNKLTGTVPTELRNLSSLRRIGLWSNDLRGNISPIFCQGSGFNPRFPALDTVRADSCVGSEHEITVACSCCCCGDC